MLDSHANYLEYLVLWILEQRNSFWGTIPEHPEQNQFRNHCSKLVLRGTNPGPLHPTRTMQTIGPSRSSLYIDTQNAKYLYMYVVLNFLAISFYL